MASGSPTWRPPGAGPVRARASSRRRWLVGLAGSGLGLVLGWPGAGCHLGEAGAADASADAVALPEGTEIVAFPSGTAELRGLLLRPTGPGPFPAVLYNHGSAPGRLNDLAFATLAPVFVARGWVFFLPYRRGQGLSEAAGPFIGDEVAQARRRGGLEAAAARQLELLGTTQLDDQLAALTWLQREAYVDRGRIVAAGNSYGGIEALLGAEHGGYCAAVDAAGGAESWAESPALRERMAQAARGAKVPVYFFQAENDYDLGPTLTLSAAMREAGGAAEAKVYPPFGTTPKEGHSFPYRGVDVWAGDVLAFVERVCPASE